MPNLRSTLLKCEQRRAPRLLIAIAHLSLYFALTVALASCDWANVGGPW